MYITTAGVGGLGLDIFVFMTSVSAAMVQMYYIPSWWRKSTGLGVMRLLRLTGWTILSARYGVMLYSTGDIMITLPNAIAVTFLAAGEVAALFNRGKSGRL